MTPSGSVTVLANFDNATNGSQPVSIMQASDGNFYGTTYTDSTGFGTAYKMTPGGSLTTLAHFDSTGSRPTGLIQGIDGNLYGTCAFGGTSGGGNGSFFKLTTAGGLTELNTTFNTPNGIQPFDTLVQTSDGNFFGTTLFGGTSNNGTVFKMTPGGSLTTIRSLTSTTGGAPRTGLALGSDGFLYGAGEFGGTSSRGTIFKISTSGTVTVLVNFDGTTNGTNPRAALIQGSDGNFYGTTSVGSLKNALSTIFKMTSTGTLTTLATFPSGQTPGKLVQGSDGSFYGTTDLGGTSNLGTAFRLNATSSENVTFASAATVPLNATAFTITGSSLNVSLGYAPTPGTVLTVIKNTGAGAISGTFSNLPDGGTINATFSGGTYTFTANYEGGDGNDLTLALTSSPASVAPTITSATGATFVAGQLDSFQVTATGTPTPAFSATGLPAWANLNSATGILSGTPPTTGAPSYAVTVKATNGVNPDSAQNFTLTVNEPFTNWESQPNFFTAQQLADPTVSGPNAKPQQDGYANLLKYLFDINPAQPMSAADRAALPVVALDSVTTPGTTYLTLTYRQYSLQTGITVNVQTSSDLSSWNTVTPDLVGQIGTDAVTGDPIMRVGVKTTGAAKEFIRLNVTAP